MPGLTLTPVDWLGCFGASSPSVNATYVPPDAASFLPPPQAMTMNARPFTMCMDGVAFPAAGSVVSQSSFPVSLS